MSARSCCRHATSWLAPSLGLALIPKCPACLAAYLFAITGAGISFRFAAGLRWGLLVVCVGALLSVALRTGARLFRKGVEG